MKIIRYLQILKTYWSSRASFRLVIFANIFLMLLRLPFSLIDFVIIKLSKTKTSEDPIFILGYYRSGTTHLQKLLSLNSNLYYINIFKTYFPDSFISLEYWLKPLTQYILSMLKVQNPIHRIDFNWDLPGEEDIAFAFLSSTFSLNWFHAFPSKLDQCVKNSICLEGEDEEVFLREYEKFLNRVKYRSGTKQLLLKSPPNTARVSSLLKKFPNAKFVFIQRNHFETLASNRYMWDVVSGGQFERVEEEQRDRLILKLEQKMLTAYHEQKHLIAKDNLYELTFEKLMDNPIREISRIFDQFSVELTNEDKLNIEKFVENKHGKHQGNYSPSSHDISILDEYPRVEIL